MAGRDAGEGGHGVTGRGVDEGCQDEELLLDLKKLLDGSGASELTQRGRWRWLEGPKSCSSV